MIPPETVFEVLLSAVGVENLLLLRVAGEAEAIETWKRVGVKIMAAWRFYAP